MSAVTPVAAYKPTNCTVQTGSDYKNTLDGNSLAAQRIVTRFAPHAASPANMTVVLDPGSIWDGLTLNELAQQVTAAFTAPVSYTRIDRVVIDTMTGVLQVVAGVEGTTPSPPAIPNGKYPVAQVALSVGMTAISNAAITDERNFSMGGNAAFGAQTSIISANVCDLGIVLSRNVLITGTTTVSSFAGSANAQSPIYLIEFAGSLTLKNNQYMLLPSSKDIQTAAGDTAVAEYLGGGYWRVRSYNRADGSTAIGAGFGAQASMASAGTVDLSGASSRNVLITGTTTTYYFAGLASLQSPIYLIEFSDSLTLKNSQYTLLPGGVDIQTAAGDTAIAEYLGGIGYWRVRSYHRASGAAIGLDQVKNVDQTNASNLTSGTVPVGQLATGTPSASTFVRGDGTWASPAAATSTAAGAVGTYAFLYNSSAGTSFGSTYSGGSLFTTDTSGSTGYTGTQQTGTWRCMGSSSGSGQAHATLFVRIA